MKLSPQMAHVLALARQQGRSIHHVPLVDGKGSQSRTVGRSLTIEALQRHGMLDRDHQITPAGRAASAAFEERVAARQRKLAADPPAWAVWSDGAIVGTVHASDKMGAILRALREHKAALLDPCWSVERIDRKMLARLAALVRWRDDPPPARVADQWLSVVDMETNKTRWASRLESANFQAARFPKTPPV